MSFKPGDRVTMARETGMHDWTTSVFDDRPYDKVGVVTAVVNAVVYVWWDGTNVFNSPHDPMELRYVK